MSMKTTILHILLLEDEAAHAELIRRAFEAQAREVQLDVVNTLQAARHRLTEVRPDLAIAELVLSDGQGTDLIPPNKDEAAYPLIIIGSDGDGLLAVEAMKAGALDYVIKSEAAFVAMPRIAERVLREWQHIIDHRQAQAALRTSEAILAHTQRLAHLGSWEFDLAADEVFWSAEIYRIYGLTPGEIKPNFETAMGFIHPDDRASAINTAKNALASGEAYHIEKRIVRADGLERYIVAHGEPIFNENQEITGLTGFLQDITERKRAEAEIRRRNRELALLNRVIAASAASQDPNAILETVCQELPLAFEVAWAAAALVDEDQAAATFVAQYVSEGNLLPLPPTIFVADLPVYQEMYQNKEPVAVADAQNDPRLAAIQSIFRERGVVSLLIIPFIVQNHFVGGVGLGTLEPRRFSTAEMRLAQSVADQVGGALARARLEEERGRLAVEYQQAQKLEAIGQLAAGIAHDFNNILMGIIGFAELLYLGLARDDPYRETASKILKSGQQGANLVRQLLAFSRKQVIRSQIVSLNEVVAGMDELLRRTIHENINLEIKLAPDLWPIKVDPVQIEQVILNLAVNARDAMPDGGQLIIETANLVLDQAAAGRHIGSEPGDYVHLIISDTGHGMSEAVQQRIFEPFFTTKALGKGTGLGLATVFGIVRQCGGHIELVSAEGVGTSFKIYIPCTWDTSLVLSQAATETQDAVGSHTILVVEDNAEVRELVQHALQAYGYTVLSAQDGQEALEVAASHPGPIHLLLTDVVMPDLGGQALAEQLVTLYPDLRVVYMSGYAGELALTDSTLQAEAIFLQKPFRPTTLAREIQAILGRDREILNNSTG
jgi:PAS domain S-box-containing protein